MWIQRMAERKGEPQNQKAPPLESRTLLEKHTEFYGNSLNIGKIFMSYETR